MHTLQLFYVSVEMIHITQTESFYRYYFLQKPSITAGIATSLSFENYGLCDKNLMVLNN